MTRLAVLVGGADDGSMAGIYVRALAGLEAAERIAKVAGRSFGGEGCIFTVETNIPSLKLHVKDVAANALLDHGTIKAWLDAYRDLAFLTCVGATVTLRADTGTQVTYASQDQLVEQLTLTIGDPTRLQQAVLGTRELFNPSARLDLVSQHLPEAEREGMRAREAAVAELTSALDRLGVLETQLIAKDAEQRRLIATENEAEHAKRLRALEERFEERERELDETHAARVKALDERIAAFDAREKAFETKEARYARRDIRKEIEKQLIAQQDFKLSEGTAEKRGIVHRVTSILIGAAALGAAAILMKVTRDGPVDWHLLVPLGAFSATLVTTFIYYLKWNDRWFREHADAELAAKRDHTDILRASWVAELVSEWETDKHEDPPPELINAFTRNLFQGQGPSAQTEHPLDSIASMVKRVTSVTVGKDVLSIQGLAEKIERPRASRPEKTKKESAEDGEHSEKD